MFANAIFVRHLARRSGVKMSFLRPLMCFCFAHVLIPLAWSADAEEGSRAKQKACISQINQRTAALVSEDWSELERLAERYVKTCKNAFDDDDYDSSSAYEQIAIANVKLNNIIKALAASESCISTFYSNSGCHLQRIEALIRLKRLTEARASLDKTEKLIKHLIELADRDIRDARSELEKELFLSRLSNLNAQQSDALAIRTRYFSQ